MRISNVWWKVMPKAYDITTYNLSNLDHINKMLHQVLKKIQTSRISNFNKQY
jgi:hypothetical protein